MRYWAYFFFAVFPFVLALALRQWARVPLHTEQPNQIEASLKTKWLAGLVSVLGFSAVVFALKQLDISGEDLDSSGLTTIAYAASRATLSLYVLGICLAFGALLLRVGRVDFSHWCHTDLPRWITCFFLGFATLGLIGTAIGLAEQLRLSVVLCLTIPLVFLIPTELSPAVSPGLNKARAAILRQTHVGLILHSILVWCLFVVLVVSLLWKGLYPAHAEQDVWNHYVHYYREVLQTGSVGPGENWGHFWDSKSAGLTHMVGVLSDEFAAQLVSWVLVLMTTVIVVDLLRATRGNVALALFGAIAFLAGVMADPSVGAFLRHHMAIAALVAFWIWSAAKIGSSGLTHRKSLTVAASVVALYTGVYATQIAPLFAAYVGSLLAIAIVRRHEQFDIRALTWLLLALMVGVLIEYLINYAATGVMSLVSARLFWSLSDQEKFGRVVGDSGLLYYLYADNDNRPAGGTIAWFFRLFRVEHFGLLLLGVLSVAIVATLSRNRNLNPVAGLSQPTLAPTTFVTVFLVVSLIPPLVFRNEALMRAYLFLNFLAPVLALLILRPIIDSCAANLFKRMWFTSLMTGVILIVLWQGFETNKKPILASLSFANGTLSYAEALTLTADAYAEPERFVFMKRIRNEVGLTPKVFTLTYAPGPGDGFPRPGLMSEPTYTLGPQYVDIVFGSPDQAIRLLRGLGVHFFHIGQQGALFSGLAFSELFRAGNLDRYFKLAFRDGDQFLLTWRDSGDTEPLPRDLVEALELRQRATYTYPFGAQFLGALKAEVRSVLANTKYDDPKSAATASDAAWRIAANLAGPVDVLLKNGMSPAELVPETRVSIDSALEKISSLFANSLPLRILALRGGVFSESYSMPGFEEVLASQIASEIVMATQAEVLNACTLQFGRPYCEILTRRDERVPFGRIYMSRDTVADLLRLNFSDSRPK
jgi:hypothetical protein